MFLCSAVISRNDRRPSIYSEYMSSASLPLRKLHFPQMGQLPRHLNSSRMNPSRSSRVEVSISGAVISVCIFFMTKIAFRFEYIADCPIPSPVTYLPSARRPVTEAHQRHPVVANGTSGRSSAWDPCPQVPQGHPRVAKGASGRSLARLPRP